MRKVNVIVILLILVMMPATAFAGKGGKKTFNVCFNQLTGAIKAKKKCVAAKGEMPLSMNTLSTMSVGPQGPMGPQGPAGPQGPKGDDGVLDPTRCITRSQTQVAYSMSVLSSYCNSGEFLLTYGVETDGASSYVNEAILLYREGESYPSGIAITMLSETDYPELFTIIVRAVCCTP